VVLVGENIGLKSIIISLDVKHLNINVGRPFPC